MLSFLAQADRVYVWDPSWWPTGGTSMPLKWLWVIGGMLVLFVAIRLGMRYFRVARRRLEPIRVFSQLAGGLGLSVEQRWVLWRVARATGLTSPITLLVCSDTLDWHGRRYVSTLSAGAARSAERQLERIAARLFTA